MLEVKSIPQFIWIVFGKTLITHSFRVIQSSQGPCILGTGIISKPRFRALASLDQSQTVAFGVMKCNVTIVNALGMQSVITRTVNPVRDIGGKGGENVIFSYKRRLVCNSCEKVKLREEAAKRNEAKLVFLSRIILGVRKESRRSLQNPSNTRERTLALLKKLDSCFSLIDQASSSFDLLCEIASSEAKLLTLPVADQNSQPILSSATQSQETKFHPVFVYPYLPYFYTSYPPNNSHL